MKIGTTSWIFPGEDMLANVTRLSGQVDDFELVFFDVPGYGDNLPTAEVLEGLGELAVSHGHSYTVHLPQDLTVTSGGDDDGSLGRARRLIEATRVLKPHAYVAHLNGDALMMEPTPRTVARWREGARATLERVLPWLERPLDLAVENIERWDAEAFTPLVEALPISRCVDVGHLWLQGVDAQAHLERWLERTRVVHLHGLAVYPPPDRNLPDGQALDHASLEHMPPAVLDPVVGTLDNDFKGVVTLEVFSCDDLQGSLAAWRAAVERTKFIGPRSLPSRRIDPAPGQSRHGGRPGSPANGAHPC